MDEFRILVIEQSVKKLFNSSFFSICTFDDIAKLLKVKPEPSIYRELSALHCVDYGDMNPRIKELLQERVVRCLRGDVDFNPAVATSQLLAGRGDFARTEDRYLDLKPDQDKKSNFFKLLPGRKK